MNKNSTLIKICGLSRPEDIDVVNELRPDFIGFVFYEKSKRNVTKVLKKNSTAEFRLSVFLLMLIRSLLYHFLRREL